MEGAPPSGPDGRPLGVVSYSTPLPSAVIDGSPPKAPTLTRLYAGPELATAGAAAGAARQQATKATPARRNRNLRPLIQWFTASLLQAPLPSRPGPRPLPNRQ